MLYFNVIVISIVSYSFVIVSFFYACSGNVKQSKLTQEEKSIVTLSPIEKKLDNHISVYSECSNYNNNLSAVASSIKFVSLATEPPLNDEFVNDIELSDDYIFILGPDFINKYDLTGKLTKRIGAKGGGPEEYIYLDPPLQLDREHRLIYALEGARHRIFVYDFDGVFKRTIPLINTDSRCFALLDSSTIALRTRDSDKFLPNTLSLLLIDHNGKKSKSYKSSLYPVPKGEHFGPEANYLWNHRDLFYTMEYGCDTVYQITKDALVPAWILTGDFILEKDELFRKDVGNKKCIGSLLFRPNAAVFESDHFILFRMMGMKERNFLVYNKATGEISRTFHKDAPKLKIGRSEILKSDYFTDNLVSGMSFDPQYQSRGRGIGFITSTDLIENKDKILDFIRNHPSEEGEHLKEIVNHIDEMDNSVLMIVDFK